MLLFTIDDALLIRGRVVLCGSTYDPVSAPAPGQPLRIVRPDGSELIVEVETPDKRFGAAPCFGDPNKHLCTLSITGGFRPEDFPRGSLVHTLDPKP